MKSDGDKYECPWEKCGGFYPVTGTRPNRVITVHTFKNKPCPGGGFNIDKPVMVEAPKMVNRARALGL